MIESTCVVAMAPIGKARPRMTRGGHVYTPAKTKDAERAVAMAWRSQVSTVHRGAIRVEITAEFKPPKSTTKKQHASERAPGAPHTQKPDIDNVCKLVLDALNGVAYDDDAAIAVLSVSKRWSIRDAITITVKASSAA